MPGFNIDFTCPLLNVIEQMAKLFSPGSCTRIGASLPGEVPMSRNLDGVEFQSVLEGFGWRPVISESNFTHQDYSNHYITVYPGSAVHYYAEYPKGSYGHSEYLHTPSELDNHLSQFHKLSKQPGGADGNSKRKEKAA